MDNMKEANITACIQRHDCHLGSQQREDLGISNERACLRSLGFCWPEFKDDQDLLQRCIISEEIPAQSFNRTDQ